MIIPHQAGEILSVTENGYGQRTALDAYRETARAGQGVIAIQVSDRNGEVVAATQVTDDAEILLVTNGGTLVRIPASEISVVGRNTQGVRLIQLQEDEKVVSVEAVDAEIG